MKSSTAYWQHITINILIRIQIIKLYVHSTYPTPRWVSTHSWWSVLLSRPSLVKAATWKRHVDPWSLITMTSQCAQWCLKSPASPLFAQLFVQAQIKENIKAPRHWPLWGEFSGGRWIPCTKGQLRGICFHLMTSSCAVVSSARHLSRTSPHNVTKHVYKSTSPLNIKYITNIQY